MILCIKNQIHDRDTRYSANAESSISTEFVRDREG